MANCCATGCASGGCGSGSAGMVTLEMFASAPDKFKPFLYEQEQLWRLSKAGYNAYIDNIKAYNSMCELAKMPERKIDERAPWR